MDAPVAPDQMMNLETQLADEVVLPSMFGLAGWRSSEQSFLRCTTQYWVSRNLHPEGSRYLIVTHFLLL